MKQIIKKFNNLVKRTIFKVENKTNNNFNISSFNKYLIISVGSLFFYLFYLSIPLLYDKAWVQTNVESKLLNEFKINLSTSANISYRILPAPHFLIKDSKIIMSENEKEKSIAEIKDLKIFLSQKNLFNKKKMNIKRVIISNANFLLLRSDLQLLGELTSKKFSNKNININNSNIFFKDNMEEIISIIKINKADIFSDDEKISNFLNLEGEIFNVPFVFKFFSNNDLAKYKRINFNAKSLKLNIFNQSIVEKEIISGESDISFLKSKVNTKYSIKEKLIVFKSNNSKLNNSKNNYAGELSINPFDLNFNIYLDDYKISKLFNINPVLFEFIESGVLFNDNISVNSSIVIGKNSKNETFQNAKINFNIINGKINFNKTTFVNDEIGTLQLDNSTLFYKDKELLFNSDILVDIKNSKNLFSFLNTNKSLRKNFKKILINLDYNFLKNKIKFNSLKIDGSEVDREFLTIIDGFNDNDLNNYNKSRRILNDFIKAYVG